jgi:hypothetical protein
MDMIEVEGHLYAAPSIVLCSVWRKASYQNQRQAGHSVPFSCWRKAWSTPLTVNAFPTLPSEDLGSLAAWHLV